MDWHERFRAMKAGLGITNSDIAKITGNTADSIKTATQPSKELPRMLKLAIVVYEKSKDSNELKNLLLYYQTDDKEAIFKFIRKRLAFPSSVVSSIKQMRYDEKEKEHYRFDMSGYEDNTGENTIHNQVVLNKFADLGIYDYTDFLTLDFYKGDGTLFYRFHGDSEYVEVNLGGYGTVEIIYEILTVTIFSDRKRRRRI